MATKKDSNYILSGRITNLQNEPLADLIVRAYDQDPLTSDDPLGEAVTDVEGRYTIHFSADALGLEFGGPDVFIRVYRDGGLLGQSPVYRDQPRRPTCTSMGQFRVCHGATGTSGPPAVALTHQLPLLASARQDPRAAPGSVIAASERRILAGRIR